MTNLELIQSKIVFQSISQELIKGALAIRSLNWADCYDSGSLENIELTIADLYVELIALPEFKEGALSIKYNVEQLTMMAANIYRKYDDDRLNDIIEPTTARVQGSIKTVNLW